LSKIGISSERVLSQQIRL